MDNLYIAPTPSSPEVDFRFDADVEACERQRFMRRFDLWMQRGGG